MEEQQRGVEGGAEKEEDKDGEQYRWGRRKENRRQTEVEKQEEVEVRNNWIIITKRQIIIIIIIYFPSPFFFFATGTPALYLYMWVHHGKTKITVNWSQTDEARVNQIDSGIIQRKTR